MRQLWRNFFTLALWIIISIACASAITVIADSSENIPPPKAKYSEKTACIEPVDVMRKKHFEFILDHRDETVVRGIRTEQYSLTGCIDCHITPNAEGKFARYSEETHFCASCHQFAAVNIDCFQCHADRPEEAIRKSLNLNQTADTKTKKIHEYLKLSDKDTL